MSELRRRNTRTARRVCPFYSTLLASADEGGVKCLPVEGLEMGSRRRKDKSQPESQEP